MKKTLTIIFLILSITAYSQVRPYVPPTDLDFMERALRIKQERYDYNIANYYKQRDIFLRANKVVQRNINEYKLTHRQKEFNVIIRRYNKVHSELSNGNYDFGENRIANHFIQLLKVINEDLYDFAMSL
jgi:hypothetical protein